MLHSFNNAIQSTSKSQASLLKNLVNLQSPEEVHVVLQDEIVNIRLAFDDMATVIAKMEQFGYLYEEEYTEASAQLCMDAISFDCFLQDLTTELNPIEMAQVEVKDPAVEVKVEVETPEDFFCPITQELMTDPVMSPDGQNYEKAAIENWLSNHNTDPMTRSPLALDQLYTNTLLKAQIEAWEKNPGVVDHNNFICPITGELMEDPVMTPYGFNYEKDAILNFLTSNPIDPIANGLGKEAALSANQLYSNLKLKGMIDSWKLAHPSDKAEVKEEINKQDLIKAYLLSMQNTHSTVPRGNYVLVDKSVLNSDYDFHVGISAATGHFLMSNRNYQATLENDNVVFYKKTFGRPDYANPVSLEEVLKDNLFESVVNHMDRQEGKAKDKHQSKAKMK